MMHLLYENALCCIVGGRPIEVKGGELYLPYSASWHCGHVAPPLLEAHSACGSVSASELGGAVDAFWNVGCTLENDASTGLYVAIQWTS